MNDALHFLAGAGEMARRMRSTDWSKTPLGAPEAWPQSLRSATSLLLSSKAQIVLFWGPDFVTLYNDAYRPVLGGKHPAALGVPSRDVWSEIWETGPNLRALFEGVVQSGDAFSADDLLFFLERYGYPEETYFDVSYDPIRDESGQVVGVFCIVSETTGRVLGPRRLRTLRDLARNASARSLEEACRLSIDSMAESAHDLPFALLLLDDAGGASPALKAATPGAEGLGLADHWPLGEVLRANESRVVDIDPSLGTVPTGAWAEAPKKAALVPIAPSSGTAPGGVLVVGLNPFRPFDDDYRAFLELLARQVSAALAGAHAYEEERRRAEALAELDHAKTVFFSNVSHEFRTPLTLLLGPVNELVERSNTLSADERATLGIAQRNGKRLLKLVNTLLDFSRIEAGRAQASYVPTDLGALTLDLTSNFRPAIERAGLRLTVDCPPLSEPAYVDRDMWEKIVLNLLSNALKFTFEGEVRVSVRQGTKGTELVVEDTGTGISASDMPRLFERFWRAEGARGRTHEGTGIGLALVHELVKLHGGSVSAESVEGKGTAFRVLIPRGSSHLPQDRVGASSTLASTVLGADPYVEEALRWLPDGPLESPSIESDESSGDRRAVKRQRIVWADDNADMREYVRRLLSPTYAVEAVANGREALARGSREPARSRARQRHDARARRPGTHEKAPNEHEHGVDSRDLVVGARG